MVPAPSCVYRATTIARLFPGASPSIFSCFLVCCAYHRNCTAPHPPHGTAGHAAGEEKEEMEFGEEEEETEFGEEEEETEAARHFPS